MSREDMLVEYMADVIRLEQGSPSCESGVCRVRFLYSKADPYAVTFAIGGQAQSWSEWTFARELLAEGLTRGAGMGIVHVCPAPHGPGDKVAITLCPQPGTGYEFVLCRAQVEAALAHMYGFVPAGGESAWIAWTRELAVLFGGEPR